MCSPLLMDTTTVLEIIKMIETQKAFTQNEYERELRTEWENPFFSYEEYMGRMTSLNELQDHLQSLIEGQLNAEENRTEQ